MENASPKALTFASRFACESATPFGTPVLPDVYWMSPSAEPSMDGKIDSGRSDRIVSTVTTCSSEGASGRSRPAARSACAKVTSRRTPALRRMPAWRRAYSSILIRAERWIERNRHAAREQDAEVTLEERELGAEEQRDALARRHAAIAQTSRDSRRLQPQRAIGNRPFVARVFAEMNVDAVGRGIGMPAENLDERARGGGRRACTRGTGVRRGGRATQGCRDRRTANRCGLLERTGESPRRVGLGQQRFWQLQSGLLFEPHHELDPFEAAQPEVARERRVRRDGATGPTGVGLRQQTPDHLQDDRFEAGGRVENRGVHRSGS